MTNRTPADIRKPYPVQETTHHMDPSGVQLETLRPFEQVLMERTHRCELMLERIIDHLNCGVITRMAPEKPEPVAEDGRAAE